MKIGGLQPFTLSDYPGCCAAIVFTLGCNFRCPYCHNKQLWQGKSQLSEQALFDFLEEKREKLDGLVITGGEPTIQPDLAMFIQRVKAMGYKIKLDTNGSHPGVLKTLLDQSLLDFIAMDIKAPFSLYSALSGVDVSIAAIQESIRLVKASSLPYLFRTTWDRTRLTEQDIEVLKEELNDPRWISQECL
ncbi:MAG: anaerobic ribonucleoside-triphosphate reductase activating protein [Pseudomonadota bacterium]|nr:anaerobic ribonucleoside-triphosphate reductase activating protein [Gammaproteobacteria bacterium]MBU1558967.1 anaerobic ribonucleoside-triphosphate reductase activating protein [Gammaproteobacteria bacterium]MBU2546701.1 anaerobic ribonucleoside-triphosphate reductase activating protein [Gammaproteobacteria bacterium]